jgi:hypothetical protein
MSDAQSIFELRLACQKPGCPVCFLVQRAGARYIESIFSESLLDPEVRQKLVVSRGFCYNHTWLSIHLKLSDALGQAILFKDLVSDIQNKLSNHANQNDSQFISTLETTKSCPACQIENETEERVVHSLKDALKDPIFIKDLSQSEGLCIPHLTVLLPKLDKKRKTMIIDLQKSRLQKIELELAEFIRKSDYRFHDEIIGKEGDSYKRAADLLRGRHLPIDKQDLR